MADCDSSGIGRNKELATKVAAMGSKTRPVICIGCHVHAGGLWRGDYIVADPQTFRRDDSIKRSKVKIHRIKEVCPNHKGKFVFPVARWRRKALLDGDTTDPEMPELVADTSDDDEPAPRPPGSSGDGLGVSAERCDPLPR